MYILVFLRSLHRWFPLCSYMSFNCRLGRTLASITLTSTGNIFSGISQFTVSFFFIQGHFGTSVMTYFRFMRWLLFLNFYLMVIMLGLTMVPYVIKINRPWKFLDTAPPANHSNTSNVTNSTGVEVNFFGKAINCTENYLDFLHNASTSEDWGSKILDALQGTVSYSNLNYYIVLGIKSHDKNIGGVRKFACIFNLIFN